MDPVWQWLIGLGATSALVVAGMLIGAFRSVYQKISRGDSVLHKRIDEVKDDYVRQDHLQTHIDHLSRRLAPLGGTGTAILGEGANVTIANDRTSRVPKYSICSCVPFQFLQPFRFVRNIIM